MLLNPTPQHDTNNLPEKRVFDACPKEIFTLFVDPIVHSLGVCRGHFPGDNRGVLLDEYHHHTRQLLNCLNFSKPAASYALECFTNCHTLRLEAERLEFMTEETITSPFLVEQKTFPFHPALLRHLTIFFRGGSLADSNRRAFSILTRNLRNIYAYFPNLRTLKIDIQWDTDEVQETFGPVYIALLARGEVTISNSPLVEIPSAHQTCERYLHLVFHLSQFCRRHEIAVEILTLGLSVKITGDWDQDLLEAGTLFPNSAAWSGFGFQNWVAGYVETTYGEYEHHEMLAGWPTEVHVLNTERTLLPTSSHHYAPWTLSDAVFWATAYPHAAAQYEADRAQEKAEREAPLP